MINEQKQCPSLFLVSWCCRFIVKKLTFYCIGCNCITTMKFDCMKRSKLSGWSVCYFLYLLCRNEMNWVWKLKILQGYKFFSWFTWISRLSRTFASRAFIGAILSYWSSKAYFEEHFIIFRSYISSRISPLLSCNRLFHLLNILDAQNFKI